MSDSTNDRHLRSDVNEIKKNVDKLLGYFYNDDSTGTKGLVQRVSDNEEAIADLKKKREIDIAVKNGQIAIYATIGSALTFLIGWIVKLLIPVLSKLV